MSGDDVARGRQPCFTCIHGINNNVRFFFVDVALQGFTLVRQNKIKTITIYVSEAFHTRAARDNQLLSVPGCMYLLVDYRGGPH